jgi:hypothetical protein
VGARRRLVQGRSLGSGFVRRIMRLIRSWGSRNLIVGGGRRGGGLGGRMGGVIDVFYMGIW